MLTDEEYEATMSRIDTLWGACEVMNAAQQARFLQWARAVDAYERERWNVWRGTPREYYHYYRSHFRNTLRGLQIRLSYWWSE